MSRNLIFNIFCLFIFLVVETVQAQRIETKQVYFEKGTNGTTIDSNIKGYQIIDYLLNAREGQLMNVSMATDNSANYFNVMEPEEEYVAIYNGSMSETTNMFERELEKSGNYRIRVYLMRSAARRNEIANFKLEILITD